MTPTDLRTRRLRLGLTQTELAARLGLPRNTVWRWEAGRLPIQHPAMLARALNDLADELAADTDPEQRHARNLRIQQQVGEPVHNVRVPAVADVLRVMREQDVDQDEAVRILGGTP